MSPHRSHPALEEHLLMQMFGAEMRKIVVSPGIPDASYSSSARSS